jgi:cyclase
MLTKRIIPCLDVRDGKVTKGIKFKGNIDIGDPVELAKYYYEEGADEIVFYDITASNEKRNIFIDVVENVAKNIFIPFTVGGGLRTLGDMRSVLLAGAEKVSIDSGAVRDPDIINSGSKAFGAQCILLSMQVLKVPVSDKIKSGYEVIIDGGRTHTGLDALQWSIEGVERGAGELCINSIDSDGVKTGYDSELTGMIASKVEVPVIASGGGGAPEHVADIFKETQAEAAILASILHNKEYTVKEIKDYCMNEQISMRN